MQKHKPVQTKASGGGYETTTLKEMVSRLENKNPLYRKVPETIERLYGKPMRDVEVVLFHPEWTLGGIYDPATGKLISVPVYGGSDAAPKYVIHSGDEKIDRIFIPMVPATRYAEPDYINIVFHEAVHAQDAEYLFQKFEGIPFMKIKPASKAHQVKVLLEARAYFAQEFLKEENNLHCKVSILDKKLIEKKQRRAAISEKIILAFMPVNWLLSVAVVFDAVVNNSAHLVQQITGAIALAVMAPLASAAGILLSTLVFGSSEDYNKMFKLSEATQKLVDLGKKMGFLEAYKKSTDELLSELDQLAEGARKSATPAS